jgi:hypothetical protein
VYVHIPKVLRSKLDPCAQRCVFVGYSDFQKGYHCYCPQTNKLHVSIDVSFHETNPYYLAGNLGSPLQGETVCEEEDLCDAVSDKSKGDGANSDKSKGDGVFIKLETFEKQISSNKQNATSLTATQTIPDERNLSLDNGDT